jgi:DNA-binding GntR family transcriptional regulator
VERLLDARSLVDALRDALQKEILRGEILPGSPLTEQGVAERYRIARPTAKAAIEQLVSDGLLRRTLNKAARVPILEVNDVRDLYFSREIVEVGIVEALAARKGTLPSARRAIEQMRQAGDNIAEVVDADIAYHKALAASLGSPRSVRLHNSVIAEAHLCMAQVQAHRLLSPATIADEHAAILDAIEGGNVAEARSLIVSHLGQAERRLVEYMTDGRSAA